MEAPVQVEWIVSKAQALGAREAEAIVTRTLGLAVEARRGVIERAIVEDRTVVGVRVLVDGGLGAAGGEVSGRAEVEELIEKAVSIARARRGSRHPGFNPEVASSRDVEIYDPRIPELGPEDATGLLERLMEPLRAPGLTIADAGLEASTVLFEYANSHGGPVSERQTSVSYGYEVAYKSGGAEGVYYDSRTLSRLDEDSFLALSRLGAERARDASRARVPEGLEAVVILEPKEALVVAGILASNVSGEEVRRRRSPLAGRLGEQVLSPELDVVDDPFIPWALGSGGFDAEGHPTSRKHVVRGGVLETYLYDHYNAALEGRESTGNATRRRPWSSTTPGPTNLVVAHRRPYENREALFSSLDKALLIASTIGSWMSLPATGTAQATVTLGYLLRHGSVEAVVKGLVWTADVYKALSEGLAGATREAECLYNACLPYLALEGTSLAGR